MYENGHGVAIDLDKAVHWYRKAAEQDNALGQFNLGDMYDYGKGVPQDVEQAALWYRMAAEQGNEYAIAALKALETVEVLLQETEIDDTNEDADLIWDDGSTYSGEHVKGFPHGIGKMTMNNGDVYKGDFVNGMRHGLGELTFSNGTQLTGRFENNEFVKNASFTEAVKIGWKFGNL